MNANLLDNGVGQYLGSAGSMPWDGSRIAAGMISRLRGRALWWLFVGLRVRKAKHAGLGGRDRDSGIAQKMAAIAFGFFRHLSPSNWLLPEVSDQLWNGGHQLQCATPRECVSRNFRFHPSTPPLSRTCPASRPTSSRQLPTKARSHLPKIPHPV